MTTESRSLQTNLVQVVVLAIEVRILASSVHFVSSDTLHDNITNIFWNVVILHNFISKLIEEDCINCTNNPKMLVTIMTAPIEGERLHVVPSKLGNKLIPVFCYLSSQLFVVVTTYYARQQLLQSHQ